MAGAVSEPQTITPEGDGMRFKDMSDDELIDFCRGLYVNGGIAALGYGVLRTHRTLYMTLYHRGLRQSALLERLGLAEEYRS